MIRRALLYTTQLSAFFAATTLLSTTALSDNQRLHASACAGQKAAKSHALRIEGRVLGQDGKPMALAHVRLSTNVVLAPGAEVQADKRGRFRIEHTIAHGSGVQLIFFGTHHRHLITPPALDKAKKKRQN